MNENSAALRIRRMTTLILFVVGVILVVLSISAELIGLNFTSGFGLVQMFQLLVGITCLTAAGFAHVQSLRAPDAPRSLQADIGGRIAATGLVFCFVSGFSDLMQIGTHLTDCTAEIIAAGGECGPFVGPWQLAGIVAGILAIIAGLLLYYTSRGTRPHSLLEFVLQDEAADAAQPEAVSEE